MVRHNNVIFSDIMNMIFYLVVYAVLTLYKQTKMFWAWEEWWIKCDTRHVPVNRPTFFTKLYTQWPLYFMNCHPMTPFFAAFTEWPSFLKNYNLNLKFLRAWRNFYTKIWAKFEISAAWHAFFFLKMSVPTQNCPIFCTMYTECPHFSIVYTEWAPILQQICHR